MPAWILLLLLSSCSHFKTREQIRAMNESHADKDQQSTLTLEDDVKLIIDEDEGEKKAVNLYIENAGLSSLSAIALLKRLELEEVKIDRVEGQGLGAIIAALYQKYEKSSMVEWHLFKVMNNELPVKEGSYKKIEKKLEKMITQLFGSQQLQQKLIAEISSGQLQSSTDMLCHNFYGQIQYQNLICFQAGDISEDYQAIYAQDFKMIVLGLQQQSASQLSFSDLVATGKRQLEKQF